MENYDGARSRLRAISLRFVCHRTIVLQIHVKNTDMLRVFRFGKLEKRVSWFAYCAVLFLFFPFFLHRFLFLLSFLRFSFFPLSFPFACISSLFSFFSYLSPTLVPFLSHALSPSFSSFISLVCLASLFSFFPCLHHFLPSLFFYFPLLSISFVSHLPFLLFLPVLIFLFYHLPAHPHIFLQVRGEIFHIRKSIWSVSKIERQVCLLIHWYQYMFSE